MSTYTNIENQYILKFSFKVTTLSGSHIEFSLWRQFTYDKGAYEYLTDIFPRHASYVVNGEIYYIDISPSKELVFEQEHRPEILIYTRIAEIIVEDLINYGIIISFSSNSLYREFIKTIFKFINGNKQTRLIDYRKRKELLHSLWHLSVNFINIEELKSFIDNKKMPKKYKKLITSILKEAENESLPRGIDPNF